LLIPNPKTIPQEENTTNNPYQKEFLQTTSTRAERLKNRNLAIAENKEKDESEWNEQDISQ
jgi:hypothetical protein